MRPKIVLIVFAAGLCLLVLVGILRTGNNQSSEIAPGTSEGTNSTPVGIPNPANSLKNLHAPTGIVATTIEQDTVKQRSIELEALEEASTKSSGDESAMYAIATRLENPDAEVRNAARDAAMHLGNKNIVPVLISVMQRSEDPREKVALMDVINYLQLPESAEPEGEDPAMSRTNRPNQRNTLQNLRQKAPRLLPNSAPASVPNQPAN